MSINVTVVGSTGVNTSIASSDGVFVSVGGTVISSGGVAPQLEAGANITITTTSGVYTFIGPNVPVQSVNGQTGTVVLNLANLTAAAASHTHLMSDITDLAYPVNVVNGQTGTVLLTSTDVSAASAVHSHVASDITNLTSVANVVSVNGQTGVAVLNSTNVSAASAVHTHVMADVTDLAFPVSSINGITGTPSIVGGVGVTVSTSGSSITIEAAGSTVSGAGLSDALPQALGSPTAGISGLASRSDHAHAMPSAADVGAAAIGHTHTRSSITDLTSSDIVFSPNRVLFSNVYSQLADLPSATDNHGMFAHVHATGRAYYAHAGSWIPLANQNDVSVTSVNGRTGTVTLTITDLTAAAASHTHIASDITNITSVANVVSVNGQTGIVTINAGDALPAQGGNATRLLTTDGTSASWATRYSVVDPVVVAGAGIVLSRDTAAGEITIGASGGIVGTTAALVETKSLSASQNDYAIGSGNIIRLNPSANVTLTGIAGGEDGVVRLLYNVGTHVVTLATGNTNSAETNRFSIVSGNVELGEGDSASVWYDATSGRWRVLEDQGAASGGGGGAGFSYLFC